MILSNMQTIHTFSSIENQTIVYNNTDFKGFGFKWGYTYRINDLNIIMISLGVVGLFGNGIAMNIIRKGRAIKKNSSYILLFNQSLTDFLSCSCIIFIIGVVHKIPTTDMSGVAVWLICMFVKTNFLAAVTTVMSSYNLSAIALDRMVSVVYPIFHRQHMDARFNIRVLISLWSFNVLIMLPFTISNNGINSRGICHMYTKLHNNAAIAHTLAFETWALFTPLLVIMYSYVRIVCKLYSSEVKLKRRGADVLKTLLTVVVVYFSCAILRTTINVAKAFGRPFGGYDSTIVTLGFLFRTISFIVNPLIYTLQYKDYRTELKRQARQVCPRLCSIGLVGVQDDIDASSMSQTTMHNTKGMHLEFISNMLCSFIIFIYILNNTPPNFKSLIFKFVFLVFNQIWFTGMEYIFTILNIIFLFELYIDIFIYSII